MTLDQALNNIARMQYPRQVNVVDGVMSRIATHPKLHPLSAAAHRWRILSAAAMLALAVGTGIYFLVPKTASEEALETMLVQYNDFSSWNTIEEAANPLADIFDENNADL
ncbi:MAG: hypothetical protein IJU19_04185 [Bacteroidales bacterium]|nr:hypothetical protein [Bacteroidales bacterium]